MRAVWQIAALNFSRFVRNRSFFVLAILAPFGITAALSSTIGPALNGLYRPDLVIADELGDGTLDPLLAGLRDGGFDDLEVVDSAAEARTMVDDGGAAAAIIFPSELGGALADPTSPPPSILVVSDADADIATSVAEAIAGQTGRTYDSVRTLSVLGAPLDDLSGALVVEEVETGVRVLTDGTYFAVGMSSYFAFFAASALVATIHRERRESTLARMLVAPIARSAPLIGKGIAAAGVALLSFLLLAVGSTLFLGAGWGPPVGVVALGLALCFSAVGVSLAIATVARTEESAGEVGAVLATAWAMFGGVFLPIPAAGVLANLSRLSPFRWVVDGVGLNAGTGSLGEVLASAVAIAAFGVVGVVIALARRDHLVDR